MLTQDKELNVIIVINLTTLKKVSEDIWDETTLK